MAKKQPPESWWKAACARIDTPLACVDDADWFVWVNGAFEELVGYSLAELREKRWQDITVARDIGADERNIQSLLAGREQSYRMHKQYLHKTGHAVSIILSVWRHYSSHHNEVWFISQVIPEHVTADQLAEIQHKLSCELLILRNRMDVMDGRRNKSRSDDNGNRTSVNIGDRNSVDVVKWLVVALVALAGVVSYVAYVGTFSQHKGEAKPPTIRVPNPD